MKIALGCDHGGYAMKEDIKKQLEGLGHEVKDCGTYSTESCDYPIFGEAAARAVASGECEYGIVVCTTGIGISIAANKVKGIRCAHCADALEAQLCRQHNNANMMAIGAGFTGPKLAAASFGPVNPAPMAIMLALLCWRHSCASSASAQCAQRIPLTLFAAIEIPMPVVQTTMPYSHSPLATARAAASPKMG